MNENWDLETLTQKLNDNPDLARVNAGGKEIMQVEAGKHTESNPSKLKGGKRKGYNKYRVAPKEDRTYNGVVYHSKREAEFAETLELRKKAGDISFWLEQAPFKLTGGVIYRLDFLIFLTDGTVQCVDVKGFHTAVYKIKKRQIEALYPIHIIEV